MKEEYEAAFLQRAGDVEKLVAAERRNAAMHFGGIVIECLLKHLILASLPVNVAREWKTDDNDPGHTITRPGHSFVEAIRKHNKLWIRVQHQPLVIKWLNEVQDPNGPFINIRYIAKEPDEQRYRHWLQSYKSLISWLQKNGAR